MKQDNGYGLKNDLTHRNAEKYFESYDGLEKVARLADKKSWVGAGARIERSLKNRD